MFCPKCKTENESSAVYCIGCGTTLTKQASPAPQQPQPSQPQQVTQPQKKRPSTLKLVLAIVLILVLAIFVIELVKDRNVAPDYEDRPGEPQKSCGDGVCYKKAGEYYGESCSSCSQDCGACGRVADSDLQEIASQIARDIFDGFEAREGYDYYASSQIVSSNVRVTSNELIEDCDKPGWQHKWAMIVKRADSQSQLCSSDAWTRTIRPQEETLLEFQCNWGSGSHKLYFGDVNLRYGYYGCQPG